MRDRQRLPELTGGGFLGLFGDNAIQVEVEAQKIIAHQNNGALAKRSDIDLGAGLSYNRRM